MKTAISMLLFVLAVGCGASHDPGDGGDTTHAVVGPACLPESIPLGGYSAVEVYLETSSASCETRACLVYHLDGDPTMLDCDGPDCVSSADAAARAFCTCRCSSDVEGSPLCECPEGFECVDDLITGGPGIAGGYCVRDGI